MRRVSAAPLLPKRSVIPAKAGTYWERLSYASIAYTCLPRTPSRRLLRNDDNPLPP